MARKIVEFPIQFENNKTIFSEDPGAELDLFLEYPSNRRVRKRDYGLDLNPLMQSTIDLYRLTSMVLIENRTKFERHIKNVTLLSARIYKLKERPRALFIEITYRENEDKRIKVKELNLL